MLIASYSPHAARHARTTHIPLGDFRMSVTAPIPSAPAASTATSVAREYVHKTAESEVLLTGLFPVAADSHRVTARWPVDHPFYGPKDGFHDPLLIAESVRQAVPLLSHAVYGVPFGHRQSWSSFSYDVDPAALAFTGSPGEIDLHITCTDVVRRGGRLSSLHMHVDLVVDGRPAGTAETTFCNLSPAIYPRLRGPYADPAEAARRAIPLAPPTAPGRVARTLHSDVVLSPTDSPARTQLRADLTHPVLFDHPVDHVPGMLLLEAARQTAHATVHPRRMIAARFEAVFTQYVELDAPCWISNTPAENSGHGRKTVRISALQKDTCAFTATAAMTPA